MNTIGIDHNLDRARIRKLLKLFVIFPAVSALPAWICTLF